MNLTKLRALIKGNKAAVTKLTSKFNADDSEINAEGIENILHSLEEKQTTIESLHSQVLEILPQENEEELEEEVIAQHDYSYSLQCTLNKIKKTLKVRNSNLNAAAEVFSNSSTETQYSTGSENINRSNRDAINSCSTTREQSRMINSYDNVQCVNSGNSYQRLPKLDLPIFTGNVIDWQAFWDSYESAIHANSSLTDVQKFNYLKSFLRGEALQTIAGFALTNVNYQKAVEILHERYGQREKIIQTYMTALLDLPAPVNNFASLRHFYDETETHIRGLDSLGQSENAYGSLLVPVILAEMKKNMTREHGSTKWNLNDIRRMFLKELTIMEAGNEPQPSTYPATSAFVTNNNKYKSSKSDKRHENPHRSSFQ
ncbi:uncharacterized protein LOC128555930 [Mercenaria mercenaria]|uniref:uncharacterized protein LOC128555930 n=1 Tax=Mercenaria mercenaria TaxID=6596 RepID=UPI00234EBD1E|nr:uncharacterized protein LOC128555930 [Mercenaria mercenaria]